MNSPRPHPSNHPVNRPRARPVLAPEHGENSPVELARSRLLLGISCVGTFVVLSVAALATGLPAVLSSTTGTTVLGEFAAIAVFVFFYALVSAPFDWIGSRLMPPSTARRLNPRQWLRGVPVQLVVYLISGALLLAGGHFGERPGAVAMLALVMIVLSWAQVRLASVVAGRRVSACSPQTFASTPVKVFDNEDVGFTGGPYGLPGHEQLILPARWIERMPATQRSAVIRRYESIIHRGSYRRGWALALAWNLIGFTLSSLLPGAGVSSAAQLLSTVCWFTLWSFAGLLLLPTLSRAAVRAADRGVLEQGVPPGDLAEAVETIRQLAGGEVTRQRAIESIFHPVPTPQRRAFDSGSPGAVRGFWHVARTALFLSWAGLGLLPRAVHCNCGRPELWVFLPAE